MLTGAGLLGALVCVGLETGVGGGAGAGAGAATGAATGAGGGLGGVELVVECCANTEEANNKVIATTRLESRMTHLLPTEQSERGGRSVALDVTVQRKDMPEPGKSA